MGGLKIKGYDPLIKVNKPKKTKGPTIIDKNKPKAPRFVYTPPELSKMSKKEREYYNDQEVERWHTGHAGLPGRQYMYYTQWKLPVGTSKRVIRPEWRDVEDFLFEEWIEAEKKNQWLWFSRREIGKSSLGAFMTWYYGRMFEGSEALLTSATKGKIKSIFGPKLYDVWEKLDPTFRGKRVSGNNTSQLMYLKLLYSFYDEVEEQIAERTSEIYSYETSESEKSATNFSSHRAKFAWIDEIGLHARRDLVLESTIPCLMEGTKQTGFLFMCGTIEKNIPSDSLSSLRKMVKDAAETKDKHVTFTPYWLGLEMENGHSNEKKAKIWRDKRIEELSKKTDQSERIAFEKNYPESLEQALSFGGENSALPELVMTQIAIQSKIIATSGKPVTNWNLVLNGDKVIPDNHAGKIEILEHPQEGEEYIAGIDPIPYNTLNEKGSSHAAVIFKPASMTPVAIYKERSSDPEVNFRHTLAMQIYYNKAQALLETNMAEALKKLYIDKGHRDLLATTPTRLGVKMTKLPLNIGFHMHDGVDQIAHGLFVKYLMNHTDKIWFDSIIEELESYRIGNTDIISAFLAMLLLLEDRKNKFKEKVGSPDQWKEIPVFVYENGRNVKKWIKVRKTG